MQRSRTYKAEGVVLSRRDLGDADRIVTLFTREFGPRRLAARGARRPTSKVAPHVELFTRVSLVGAAGASLDVLTQAQTIETYARLRTDLRAFAAAGWAAELLDGLSDDGAAMPQDYAALVAFLRALDRADADPAPLLAAFAIALLDAHGYGPELERCTVCTRRIAPDDHAFTPGTGGVTCLACARQHTSHRVQVDTLKALRFVAREGVAGAERLRTTARVSAELRGVLRAYAATMVEREIASARILERAGAAASARRR